MSTPIYIVSFNRLRPLQLLVESLQDRGYYDITIIDTGTTFPPLLEWYAKQDIQLVSKPGADHNAGNGVVPTDKWYVYTDSDCVPSVDAPRDFIHHMIEIGNRNKLTKVGLSLRTNDLPDHFAQKQEVIDWEKQYQSMAFNVVETPAGKFRPVIAAVDTTFAVVAPGARCGYTENSIRMPAPYECMHMPWYYDSENLPMEERWFRSHKLPGIGHWSSK